MGYYLWQLSGFFLYISLWDSPWSPTWRKNKREVRYVVSIWDTHGLLFIFGYSICFNSAVRHHRTTLPYVQYCIECSWCITVYHVRKKFNLFVSYIMFCFMKQHLHLLIVYQSCLCVKLLTVLTTGLRYGSFITSYKGFESSLNSRCFYRAARN